MEDQEPVDTVMDSAEMHDRIVDHDITADERTWVTILHLAGFVGFILTSLAAILITAILWMIKKDDSPFLDDHGREALNFQVTMAIYSLLAWIPLFFIVGPLAYILVNLFGSIAMIMMALRARRGEFVRYPMTIRFFTEA